MKRYVIVTESGSDLSRSIIDRYGIQVLPMHVTMGAAEYDDGSFPIEELCGYYEKTRKVPTTSAVNPYEYQCVFDKIRAETPDTYIIHIGYSSRVSSTYQNAVIAGEGNDRIHHIDSMNVSGGLALIVVKAAEWIEQDPEVAPEELVARITAAALATRFWFVPGNLDFLRAGGRVSNAQYLGASILRLKPLIEIIEGRSISTKKYKGDMKSIALQMIRDFFSEHKIDRGHVNLIHTGWTDEDTMAEMVNAVGKFGVKHTVWLQTGCVITAHAGPGGIGIAAMEASS